MAFSKRNKTVAALFALFGGSFGLHKFYLRDFSGGIFYLMLLFMSTIIRMPISQILGVFDAIKLFMMSQDQFDRKYNNKPQNSPYRRNRNVPQREVRRRAEPKRTSRHNPFIKSANNFYKDYALEEAAADYERALEIDPNNKKVLFNAACVFSLLENKTASMNALQRLIDLGYADFEKIEKHDDLAFLRIQPEFEKFKANGYKNVSSESQEEKYTEEEIVKDDLLLSQLNKLVELRQKGLLSENEFSLERKKLLRR